MKHVITGEIDYFDLDSSFPINIKDRITIHFNKEKLGDILYYPDFKSSIGLINHNLLIEKPIHLSVLNGNSYSDGKYEVNPYTILNVNEALMHSFQVALWFVKDNSMNLGSFYFYEPTMNDTIRIVIKNLYSDANGEYKTVAFTRMEVEDAINWMEILNPYLTVENEYIENEKLYDSNKRKYLPYKDLNRVAKALLLVSNARSDSFLPSKIASYISAIEAVVASERGNLVSQVAERTAILIGRDRNDKLEVHDLLRDAYKSRSSFVHGDNLSRTIDKKIEELSLSTDKIVRRLLTTVIDVYPEIVDMNAEKLTEWYKENMLFK